MMSGGMTAAGLAGLALLVACSACSLFGDIDGEYVLGAGTGTGAGAAAGGAGGGGDGGTAAGGMGPTEPWLVTLHPGPNGDVYVLDVANTDAGGVVAVGSTTGGAALRAGTSNLQDCDDIGALGGDRDWFVIAIDAAGAVTWCKQLGGANDTGEFTDEEAAAVAVDGSTVLVGGRCRDVDGVVGQTMAPGDTDACIVELELSSGEPTGAALWLGMGDAVSIVTALALLEGHVFAAGTFASTDTQFHAVGTSHWDGCTVVPGSLTATTARDLFLLRRGPGDCFVDPIEDAAVENEGALALVASTIDRVFVGGDFNGAFAGLTTAPGDHDGFIARFDFAGASFELHPLAAHIRSDNQDRVFGLVTRTGGVLAASTALESWNGSRCAGAGAMPGVHLTRWSDDLATCSATSLAVATASTMSTAPPEAFGLGAGGDRLAVVGSFSSVADFPAMLRTSPSGTADGFLVRASSELVPQDLVIHGAAGAKTTARTVVQFVDASVVGGEYDGTGVPDAPPCDGTSCGYVHVLP
jgi:hypothetical protein